MKILIVGGGSGGHITPAVTVIREIFAMKPRAMVEFWTDFKYFKNVTKLTTELKMPWEDTVDAHMGSGRNGSRRPAQTIRVRRTLAGKFHRYAGWKFADYFKHFGLTLKDIVWGNFLGLLGFLGGLLLGFVRMLRPSTRPDVIFLKGGYVGLPVGLVARVFRIPYVIHESDATVGLANRLLMKHARKVAFGVEPASEILAAHPNYIYTGIPVGPEFRAVTESRERSLKKSLSFDPDRPLVVITGGSQGSENLNLATREILPELLKVTSVALVAGRKHYEDVVDLKKYENWEHAELSSNFRMWEFNTNMSELLGAADVVVSRAGATTITELSCLKKAVVLVPFEFLPGSHQVKNAKALESAGAVKVLMDAEMMADPEKLLGLVRHLVRSPKERTELAEKLHSAARPDAARVLAEIIIGAA